eukprot:scaffold58765_cov60-Phaeocystis_antarctica.AAC.3
MSGCQPSTKWAGCYPCRQSHTSGGLGGAGEASKGLLQTRGPLRGQERVDSAVELGDLHRYARARRVAGKGDARRAVEIIASAKLIDARDDAGGLSYPLRAHLTSRR